MSFFACEGVRVDEITREALVEATELAIMRVNDYHRHEKGEGVPAEDVESYREIARTTRRIGRAWYDDREGAHVGCLVGQLLGLQAEEDYDPNAIEETRRSVGYAFLDALNYVGVESADVYVVID